MKKLNADAYKNVSRDHKAAVICLDPVDSNAMTTREFSGDAWGPIALDEVFAVANQYSARIEKGDLSCLESMLGAQAFALNAIFNNLAKRAQANIGTNTGAMDVYLRLALKAQSQCRTTVEALSEIKSPRAAATFIKQANVGQNVQVNNGGNGATRTRAPARENQEIQNKLLTEGDGSYAEMDTGRTVEAVRIDSEMEAMGAIKRSENGRGKRARKL
ncbi:hypothetical protein [Collimonas arenae]|uniref:hypothetical protein n=1 Tax=Collimonas arenae TaxID=279058 RepID=UPI00068BA040|nr:hypothetical protein [Collimonas arenae]